MSSLSSNLRTQTVKPIEFQLHSWSSNLQGIADRLVKSYKNLLQGLNFWNEEGAHGNTAFGLTFPYEYANCKLKLKQIITLR